MSGNRLKAPLRAMELFAGVGGFRIGLEGLGTDEHPSNADFEVVISNQFEPRFKRQHASEVYVHRFGAEGHINEDINFVVNDPSKFTQILDARPDVLVGGFPCQDYSVANSNAQGLAGAKGALWWSIHQCLLQLQAAGQPVKYLILENVGRLLKSPTQCRGQDFAIILASLSALGYAVEWRVVNAADYGFAQARERVFIMAYHCSTDIYEQIVRDSGALPCEVTVSTHATQWMVNSGLLATALPVSTSAAASVQCFAVGSDYRAVASTYQPRPNKASQFENSGMMVNGTVYTVRTKAADMVDYTSFVGTVKAQTLGDIVCGTGVVAEEFYVDSDALQQWKTLKGAKTKERICKDTGHAYTYSEGAVGFPDALERPSRTIITGEGGAAASRFKHVIRTADGRLRRLVPQELEALNGFPRGFTDVQGMKDAKRAFFMGNALVVGIVAALGRELAQRIQSLQLAPANSHPKPEANDTTGNEGEFGGSAPGANALPPTGLLSVCAPYARQATAAVG